MLLMFSNYCTVHTTFYRTDCSLHTLQDSSVQRSFLRGTGQLSPARPPLNLPPLGSFVFFFLHIPSFFRFPVLSLNRPLNSFSLFGIKHLFISSLDTARRLWTWKILPLVFLLSSGKFNVDAFSRYKWVVDAECRFAAYLQRQIVTDHMITPIWKSSWNAFNWPGYRNYFQRWTQVELQQLQKHLLTKTGSGWRIKRLPV